MAIEPSKKIIQDSFDIAFVKVITSLQHMGYCRNEAAMEREFGLGRSRIYEIKRGTRHVPRRKRDMVLAYFIQKYDVNPNIFQRPNDKMFMNEPPRISDPGEEYAVERTKTTAGDIIYIKKLESDNKHLSAENDLLKKLVSTLEKQVNKSKK